MDEEGPEKREELREERTLWVTDQIAQEKFPEDLEDFYINKTFVKEEPLEATTGGKGDKKADKKDDKKATKGKDDKKGTNRLLKNELPMNIFCCTCKLFVAVKISF